MATEWISGVDTAVKIGLGAILTSISAYTISSLNHKKEIQKGIINKKVKMIEDLSEHIEKYFYYTTKFYNVMKGMQLSSGCSGQPLSPEQRKRAQNVEHEFKDVLEYRNKAASRIKILSISPAENALKEYHACISDFREQVLLHGLMPTEEYLSDFNSKRQLYQNNFYKAIGDYLDSIQS